MNQDFNKVYDNWKNWNSSNFGNLNKNEEKLFDKIISISKIKHQKNKGFKVLKIGFGNGNFLRYGKNKFWDILGFEINQTLVEEAISKGFKAIKSDNLDYIKGYFLT